MMYARRYQAFRQGRISVIGQKQHWAETPDIGKFEAAPQACEFRDPPEYRGFASDRARHVRVRRAAITAAARRGSNDWLRRQSRPAPRWWCQWQERWKSASSNLKHSLKA